jgi:chemotaxis protein CheD
MATHDRGGDRPVWAPTRPFELAMAARSTGFADTLPSERYVPVKPAEAQSVVRPAARPVLRPAAAKPAARPAAPVSAFQPTRPAELFQATQPADLPVTLPATLPATPPTTPPRRPAAAAPARPAVSAPSASGHWQLAGKPGEHLVLMPGQMHLGQQAASVRTLLGSCVAITLWHPVRRIGGMCHFLLPQRQRRPGDAPDGRYGDEAVEAMVKTLQTLRAEPREFVAHLYGGADTLSGCSAVRFNIGERNIEQGWRLIDRFGFTLDGVDVGDDIPRVVSLALSTGQVSMRRGSGSGKAPDHLRDSMG